MSANALKGMNTPKGMNTRKGMKGGTQREVSARRVFADYGGKTCAA